MQNLFRIVPNDFFTLLTLDEKDFYVDLLILVWSKFKNSEGSLSYDEFLVSTEQLLYDRNLPITHEELNAKARDAVKKLYRYGWISIEDIPQKLEKHIRIPYYSSRFIDAIYSILNPTTSTTQNFASNVLLNLKNITFKNEGEQLLYLENAERDANNLLNFIFETFDIMKHFQTSLLKQAQLEEILIEHFADYASTVSESRFHKLIASENILKYRQNILSEIDRIEYDEQLLRILGNLLREKDMDSNSKASDMELQGAILTTLNKINFIFENIDTNMDTLRNMHSKYVRTTATRISCMINQEQDVSDLIKKIFNVFPKTCQSDITLQDILSKKICLNDFKGLDENSIYRVSKRKPKFNVADSPIISKLTNNTDIKSSLLDYLAESNSYQKEFTEESIIDFILNLIGDNKTFNTKSLNSLTHIDFLKILLGFDMSDKNDYFESDAIGKNVSIGDFKIPEILFRRKKCD